MRRDRAAEAVWIVSRKRWQCNVQKDGIRKTFTSSLAGRKGKHEAEKKADTWLAMQGNPKVRDAWEECITAAAHRYAATTIAVKRTAARGYILPLLGERRIGAVSVDDWQRRTDKAAALQSSITAVIYMLATYCRRRGWPVNTPMDGDLSVSKTVPIGTRSALDAEHIRLLFEPGQTGRCTHWLQAWQLMALTGLRLGEMCGLQWGDIHDDYLQVNRAINRMGEITHGKTSKARRVVALSEIAKEVLDRQRRYLTGKGIESDWVFPGPKGGAPSHSSVSSNWKMYCKERGLNCKMHELRHTFVSLVKNDMPLALLKSQVGHSTAMDTLGVYGHTSRNDMAEIARIIDGAYLKVFGE